MPVLFVEKGKDKGKSITLDQQTAVIIGRDSALPMAITDVMASRQHARIFWQDGLFWVEDLQSRNGTFVNGEKISEITSIKPGDQICIGGTLITFLQKLSQLRQDHLTGQTIKGYQIIERLGQGGMGTVYKALQISLKRHVALKILSPKLVGDQKFIKQFIEEARASALLNHPNIIQVYDVGKADAYYYFSMEYAQQGSVQDRLSREGRIPVKEAVAMMLDAARGLEYAEKKQIVHRDIKPDNLMITDEGRVKIGDLGLAKKLDDLANNKEKVVFGTPLYIAPEQVLRKPVDHRTDIYALGASFYCILAGKPPFSGETTHEIISKHIKEYPPPLRSFVPDIPDKLVKIIGRMMEKRPEDRYASATQLIADLESLPKRGIVRGRPKKGRRMTASKRSPEAPYTIFALVGALAVVLLLLIVIAYLPVHPKPRQHAPVTTVKPPSPKPQPDQAAQEALRKANAYYAKVGDTLEALQLYRQVAQQLPQGRMYNFVQDRIRKISAQIDKAHECFRKAQQIDKSLDHHYEKVISFYQEVIDNYPQSPYSGQARKRIQELELQRQKWLQLKQSYQAVQQSVVSLIKADKFVAAARQYRNFIAHLATQEADYLQADVQRDLQQLHWQCQKRLRQCIALAQELADKQQFAQALKLLRDKQGLFFPECRQVIAQTLAVIRQQQQQYLQQQQRQQEKSETRLWHKLLTELRPPQQELALSEVVDILRGYQDKFQTPRYRLQLQQLLEDFQRIVALLEQFAQRVNKGKLSNTSFELPLNVRKRFMNKEQGRLVQATRKGQGVKIEVRVEARGVIVLEVRLRDLGPLGVYDLLNGRWSRSAQEELALALFCWYYRLYHQSYQHLQQAQSVPEFLKRSTALQKQLQTVEQTAREKYQEYQQQLRHLRQQSRNLDLLSYRQVVALRKQTIRLHEQLLHFLEQYEYTRFYQRILHGH